MEDIPDVPLFLDDIDSLRNDLLFSPHESPIYSPDSTFYDLKEVSRMMPYLEIIEEPCKLQRFRYLTELQGTPHGPIMGASYVKGKIKTYPSVQLHNYPGEAAIRCWLVESDKENCLPHAHQLAVKQGRDSPSYEPHKVVVNSKNNHKAEFKNMVILHSTQKEPKDFQKKLMLWKNRWLEDSSISQSSSTMPLHEVKRLQQKQDKNTVYLYFEAYVQEGDSQTFLCSCVSSAIRNQKSRQTGELKIVRQSLSSGSAGDEMFIFTSKIANELSVLFFSEDHQWSHPVSIAKGDIHQNVAIVCRIPEFPFTIEPSGVQIKFCLVRESDGAMSNTCDLTYFVKDDTSIQEVSNSKRSLSIQRAVKRKKTDEVDDDNSTQKTARVLLESSSRNVTEPESERVKVELINQNDLPDPVLLLEFMPTPPEQAISSGEVNYFEELINYGISTDGSYHPKRNYKNIKSVPLSEVDEQDNQIRPQMADWSPAERNAPEKVLSRMKKPTIFRAPILDSKQFTLPPSMWSKVYTCIRESAENLFNFGQENLFLKYCFLAVIIGIILMSNIYLFLFILFFYALWYFILNQGIPGVAHKERVYELLENFCDIQKILEEQDNETVTQILDDIMSSKSLTCNAAQITLIKKMLRHCIKKNLVQSFKITNQYFDHYRDWSLEFEDDRNFNSLYHVASTHEECCLLKYMMNTKYNNSVAVFNKDGLTCAHVAVQMGVPLTLSYIIDTGEFPLQEPDKKSGRTPLHLAASLPSRLTEIELLVKKGHCDINCKDRAGYTPLHLAVLNGNFHAVRLLLMLSADPEVTFNSYGEETESVKNDVFSLTEDPEMLALLEEGRILMKRQKINCDISKEDIEEVNKKLETLSDRKEMYKLLNLEHLQLQNEESDPCKFLSNYILTHKEDL